MFCFSNDHAKYLEEGLNILKENNMKLNHAKCHFGVRSGKFLGYIVIKTGINEIQEKIKEINNMKSPTST